MHFRALIIAFAVAAPVATACSYCNPGNANLQTFRQEARNSKFVVVGTLTNPRLVGDRGYTDLTIEQAVKNDPAIAKLKTITLNRWHPVDPKKPPRMLVFFDIYDGKFDAFRGVTLRGKEVGDYMRGALARDDRDRIGSLLYYFRFLDSPDPDVAGDAFLEFAKATDREIGAIGPKLEPAKIRKLLADPKTPAARLGVFAFLFGACGKKSDADTLSAMLDKTDERSAASLSGLLGGLIEIRSDLGWKRAIEILDDSKRPYQDKLAVLGTARFFEAYKPKEFRKEILAAMAAIVSRGDMADMAIEDLRRWKWWDLTKEILAQYGKPTHAAPLVKNAILRYALCCPDAEAASFIRTVRATDPAAVRELEQSLEFERPVAPRRSDHFVLLGAKSAAAIVNGAFVSLSAIILTCRRCSTGGSNMIPV